MVLLYVKLMEETLFTFNSSSESSTDKVIEDAAVMYNGKLKVGRICYEIEELVKHGTLFPPEILDVYEEDVEKLGLKDEWGEICLPVGGYTWNRDPVGRRNGKKPNVSMSKILTQAIEDANHRVLKKPLNMCLSIKEIQEVIDLLKEAILAVYPMNLPPHDIIRKELENDEDLSETQAAKEVIDFTRASLWFSDKPMMRERKLKDYVGTNEKTKIIVYLSRTNDAPIKHSLYSEEERKELIKQAQMAQLEPLEPKKVELDDDNYTNVWAQKGELKRQCQGIGNISLR